MAVLRNRRKLVEVSSETPEITKNNQSQNTLHLGTAEEYLNRVFEGHEERVIRIFSQEHSRMKSCVLGALLKLDEFLLSPQVRRCSVAVPGLSMVNNSENREPTANRSIDDPSTEVILSSCHTNNLKDWEQEETHHNCSDITFSMQNKNWCSNSRKCS